MEHPLPFKKRKLTNTLAKEDESDSPASKKARRASQSPPPSHSPPSPGTSNNAPSAPLTPPASYPRAASQSPPTLAIKKVTRISVRNPRDLQSRTPPPLRSSPAPPSPPCRPASPPQAHPRPPPPQALPTPTLSLPFQFHPQIIKQEHEPAEAASTAASPLVPRGLLLAPYTHPQVDRSFPGGQRYLPSQSPAPDKIQPNHFNLYAPLTQLHKSKRLLHSELLKPGPQPTFEPITLEDPSSLEEDIDVENISSKDEIDDDSEDEKAPEPPIANALPGPYPIGVDLFRLNFCWHAMNSLKNGHASVSEGVGGGVGFQPYLHLPQDTTTIESILIPTPSPNTRILSVKREQNDSPRSVASHDSGNSKKLCMKRNIDQIEDFEAIASHDNKKKKLSKDERSAMWHGINAADVDRIIAMPMDEFTDYCSVKNLAEDQVTLLKDIRRRGKNKVAAQNCRKRKIDQIEDLKNKLDEAERIRGRREEMIKKKTAEKEELSEMITKELTRKKELGIVVFCRECPTITEKCKISHTLIAGEKEP